MNQTQHQAAYAVQTMQALAGALRVQTMVAALLALGLLLVGPVAAYSSLCGSLTAYLPGLMFVISVARKIGSDSTRFLQAAVLAELAKLILTGVLCALVFIWVRPLAPMWFFAGMIAVLVTSWIGLARAIR